MANKSIQIEWQHSQNYKENKSGTRVSLWVECVVCGFKEIRIHPKGVLMEDRCPECLHKYLGWVRNQDMTRKMRRELARI